ncbi:Glutathione S-transferase kappa 1 [Mortierella alpina]|uniref:Glutathione S-transferase kappa 1 n=1 Tax=Mortierella alpina TaxID=64518 RepID=A0A9P6JBZ6_MORAP|nr:Glutathione S-transferase kappa 1 [Mortierella alpina]
MAARASIICYYDLISPYTFMGFKLFNRFRKQWPDVDVTFQPILLGGVMAKADLDRISAVTGIPFKFPTQFPVSTILPMRLLTVLQIHEAEKYEQCIDKDEYFVHGHNISQADVLQTALKPIFKSDATDPEIKQIFKQNTDEAIARGVFGAPTFIVKKAGEPAEKEYLFFGSDRFEMIAAFLGLPYSGLIPKDAAANAKL